jgi:hypothetical protein
MLVCEKKVAAITISAFTMRKGVNKKRCKTTILEIHRIILGKYEKESDADCFEGVY